MQSVARMVDQGIPFSVSGEILIMWLQFTIIIALIWKYNTDIKMQEKMMISGLFLVYGFILFGGFMQNYMWDYIGTFSTLLNVYSAGGQIWMNF